MKTSRVGFLTLCLMLGMLATAMAQTSSGTGRHALPYPHAGTPKAVDRGSFTAQAGSSPISATIALSLPALGEAENLLNSLHAPGDPEFHHFLTAQQFEARFAPKDADVARVVAHLAQYGLSAKRTSATTLKVTGLPADMERAFAVNLRSYEVAAHGNARGYTFHAPDTHPTIPAEISVSVAGVAGLDSRPSLRPHNVRAPQAVAKSRRSAPSAQPGNDPGFWTVTDLARYYNVQPLYKRGLTGKGRTLGILTFASFTPSDAFAYWSAIGLSVKPNRISIVDVDGGPGAPSDASGSEETTLDVEQSGGLAPGAKVIVYQAPNTNEGFVDLFAAAVDSNSAQTLSISWGSWEWFNNLENSPVADPFTGRTVGIAQAIHELLLRGAIQGQSFFAASGDSGAYDTARACPSPFCSVPLSVDYPASDSAITGAGGTTLPGLQEFCLNTACTPPFFDVNIAHERVWGWDYIGGLCVALGIPSPIDCGIFPVGTGGGVSVLFPKPLYQFFLPGTQRSQPGQAFTFLGDLVYALPANYPGRNVPDVSLNADPDTGYVIGYTPDAGGFGFSAFWGGTSFVAPQLNGISALLGEDVHGRIGLLNFPLYALALTGRAYRNPGAPLHAIHDGNNWFYQGSNGYNPAVGLGTMDVANFDKFLRDLF